jgi:hypothetical protein
VHWLITAPGYSATRKQWILAVITLGDTPGFKPARLDFEGATHEVIIMPVDPAGGDQSANSVVRLLLAHSLPMIPADAVRFQVRATDSEVMNLSALMATAVVRNRWSPDVTGDPGNVRGAWRESAERNLLAIRAMPARNGTAALPAAPVTAGALTPPGGHVHG